jgi:hypothetical protein
MKGQGATEYLVLLAVVLIVALFSVALLGFFPGMASDSQVAESQAYWAGAAKPFQVIEAASSSDTMCGIAWAHGYALTLQNTEADTITVTNIKTDGSAGFCVAGGVANASVNMGPGDRKLFYVMTSTWNAPCTGGQIAQMGLNIMYRTAFISGKVQYGEKKLVMRCTTSITAAENATGGNVTIDGDYRVHTFTGSGTFTPNGTTVVEVLVVAGAEGAAGERLRRKGMLQAAEGQAG